MSSVDVVVPCYNYGRFLKQCVDSVTHQRGVNIRVLIIDDASIDCTADVAQDLAMQDARVQFRRHETNRGHIATYNEGLLHWASAQYCLLLSADDMLAPSALERATRLLDRHSDVGMTYGMAIELRSDTQIYADSFECEEFQIVSGSRFLRYCFTNGNPVPTPTAVVRTALLKQFGGYSATLPHTADMEMWMQFALHGRIGIFRAPQAYYRLHGENMSSGYYDRPLGDCRERLQACADIACRYSAQLPEANVWLMSLSRSLGWDAFWSASRAFDRGDRDACDIYLQFCEEVCPEIQRLPEWVRLRTKMIFGRVVCERLQPFLDRLRGKRQDFKSRAHERPTPAQHTTGWWPERV